MISEPVRIRVRGPWACFTRPEFKVERVSYPVITPSAARGVLEAILMKPIEKPEAEKRHDKTGFRWRVLRIGIINKGFLTPILRNELGYEKHAYKGFDIMAERSQRHSLILSGGLDEHGDRQMLDYLIEAVIEVPNGQAYNNGVFLIAKYQEMFERYSKAGRCFHRPYFGCREFACDFEWAKGVVPNATIDKENFGPMLRDFNFDPIWDLWPPNTPRPVKWQKNGHAVRPVPIAFQAKAESGWINVARVEGRDGKREIVET